MVRANVTGAIQTPVHAPVGVADIVLLSIVVGALNKVVLLTIGVVCHGFGVGDGGGRRLRAVVAVGRG